MDEGKPGPEKPIESVAAERLQISDNEIPNNDDDAESADRGPGLFARYPILRHALIGLFVVGAIAGIVWYSSYRTHGRYLQSTNNAYIRADFVTVSPKVSGYVDRVLVTDNQSVRRGELLAVLDARDYRANVAQANAQIRAATANVLTANRTLDEQRSSIEQSAAQVAATRATAISAENEVRRYEPLTRSGAESRERLAALVLQRDRAVADLRAQRAAFIAASRSIATQRARIAQAEAQRDTAQAQYARASTDLSAVEIRSSIDGVVADKAVRAGQFLQPATRLMSIVPTDQIYIEANFKETQVALMRVGQPTTIKVDALDGAQLRGRVASISPGTGAQFSLIPPENATGNFTKIVQRVPVRISIVAGPEALRVLRPGLSVEVTVDTVSARYSRKLIDDETERLRQAEARAPR